MQWYNELHQHAAPRSARVRKGTSCNANRLNIDDTDSESDDDDTKASDPSKPWLDKWNTYFHTLEVVPDGMGIVRWWGVCTLYSLVNLVSC